MSNSLGNIQAYATEVIAYHADDWVWKGHYWEPSAEGSRPKRFSGPTIMADSFASAERICNNHIPYCKVVGVIENHGKDYQNPADMDRIVIFSDN